MMTARKGHQNKKKATKTGGVGERGDCLADCATRQQREEKSHCSAASRTH
jgi:hypothetical protein